MVLKFNGVKWAVGHQLEQTFLPQDIGDCSRGYQEAEVCPRQREHQDVYTVHLEDRHQGCIWCESTGCDARKLILHLSLPPPPSHTHTRANTHTHTYIHVHTHTLTYVYCTLISYTRTCTHSSTHMHAHTHTCNHTHSYIHVRMHVHMHTLIHIHSSTYTHMHHHAGYFPLGCSSGPDEMGWF